MMRVERAGTQDDIYPTAESFVVEENGALVLYSEEDDEVAAYPPGGWLRAWREVRQ